MPPEFNHDAFAKASDAYVDITLRVKARNHPPTVADHTALALRARDLAAVAGPENEPNWLKLARHHAAEARKAYAVCGG